MQSVVETWIIFGMLWTIELNLSSRTLRTRGILQRRLNELFQFVLIVCSLRYADSLKDYAGPIQAKGLLCRREEYESLYFNRVKIAYRM